MRRALMVGGCSLVCASSGFAIALVASCGSFSGTTESSNAVDASAVDASAAVDASPTIDAAVADGPFCASLSSPPTFCSDFDENDASVLSDGWDKLIAESGTVVLDTKQSLSAPRSLGTTITDGNAAGIQKVFPVVTTFSVALDFRMPVVPDSGDLGALRLETVTPGPTVLFYAKTTGTYVQLSSADGAQNEFSSMVANLAPDAWHHLTLDIAVTGASSSVSATLDGTSLWAQHAMNPPVQAGNVTLQVGAASIFGVTSGQTWVDNVVVRVN